MVVILDHGSPDPRGYNLAPKANEDDLPRGAMRILNAGAVQAAFRKSGRTTSEDTGEKRSRQEEDKPKKKAKSELPKIAPNESLGAYNRRVEALLRGGVSSAIKKAETTRALQVKDAKEAKAARVAKAQGKEEVVKDDEDKPVVPNRPAREFKELPTRRRLNDVAQAPPALPRLKVAEKGKDKSKREGRTPVNAGQARIMEAERERVVALYREMKAKKLEQSGV